MIIATSTRASHNIHATHQALDARSARGGPPARPSANATPARGSQSVRTSLCRAGQYDLHQPCAALSKAGLPGIGAFACQVAQAAQLEEVKESLFGCHIALPDALVDKEGPWRTL